MSEYVYQQVEKCIREKLYVGCEGMGRQFARPQWIYPEAIELGLIVCRDADCGSVRPPIIITPDEWARRVELYGLWKQVGAWSFTRADNPAAACIAYCGRSPHSAGEELYRLRLAAQLEETP